MNEVIHISAILEPDDGSVRVEFDAVDWFRDAAISRIVKLAHEHWGGSYEADEIAETAAEKLPAVANVFSYLDAANTMRQQSNPGNYEPLGFECHVDPGRARAWLKEHRPDAYTALVNAELYEACKMAVFYWDASSPHAEQGPTEQDDRTWTRRTLQAAAELYEPKEVRIA